jgi:DNA-binding HxlR family transcriptional regulator
VSVQVETAARPERGDAFDSACPTRAVLDHVTSKWAVLVLAALAERPLRFSALRRRILGVSEKMLAQTLRTLEGDGFVAREVAPTTPPQVTYSLTGLGEDLTPHMTGLLEFLATRIPDIQAARTRS